MNFEFLSMTIYYLSIPICLIWNFVKIRQSGTFYLNDVPGVIFFSLFPVINTLVIGTVIVAWLIQRNFILWQKKPRKYNTEFEEGFDSFSSDDDLAQYCPYPKDSVESDLWLLGYRDASLK